MQIEKIDNRHCMINGTLFIIEEVKLIMDAIKQIKAMSDLKVFLSVTANYIPDIREKFTTFLLYLKERKESIYNEGFIDELKDWIGELE